MANLCRDWLEAQEAKKTAAAAVADDDAPKRKKKPKKPTIQFAQGATAQESVERMFESKNLKSRVNQEMLKQFFEYAPSAPRACASSEQRELVLVNCACRRVEFDTLLSEAAPFTAFSVAKYFYIAICIE